MRDCKSSRMCSSSKVDNSLPARFLLAGAWRNRVAIAGFALGLSGLCTGFGVVLLVGLVLLNIWAIPSAWSAWLVWIIVCAPAMIAVGFLMLTYLKPRPDHPDWRRLCRIMRVMIFLTAAIWVFLVTVEAVVEPSARISSYRDGDVSGPVGLWHLLRLSELAAVLFSPAVFLSFLTLTSMFRYLARHVAGARTMDQCVILQVLCSMFVVTSLVVSVQWGAGLVADLGFNSPWLLFRVYPLISGSERFFLWMLMLLVAWLTVLGVVLLVRLMCGSEAAPHSPDELFALLPDGIWPFHWTRRRAFSFYTVLAGVALLSSAYIIMETRWDASQAIKAAEAFLVEPSRADTNALARGIQKGLLPQDLGNRVLDKAAKAQIVVERRSDSSIKVSVEYPDSFRTPSAYRPSRHGLRSRKPFFARGMKRPYPAHYEISTMMTGDEHGWNWTSSRRGRHGIGWDASPSIHSLGITGEVQAGVHTEVRVWPEGHRGDPAYETVTDVFKTFSLDERDD